mgnify:CR=1 FL=1
MTTITINHASYQVSREVTELNVTENYIQYKLAKNIEGMNGEDFNQNSFWAELDIDGGIVRRYKIENDEFTNYLSY